MRKPLSSVIAGGLSMLSLMVSPVMAAHQSKSFVRSRTPSYKHAPAPEGFKWIQGADKIVQPVGISKVVQESNRQALKLLSALGKTSKDDFVISPAGSTAAHLLLLNGLRGNSRSEFAQSMGISQTADDALADRTAEYLKLNSSLEPKCVFGVACATNPPFSFQQKYSNLIQDRLGGLVLNNAELERDKLRAFILKKTEGKFGANLEGPPPMVLRLYSTVYFNGVWSQKFESISTKPEAFHKADGSTVLVPMMNTFFQGPMLYLDGKNFQALRMPYLPSVDANDVHDAMYILLPHKGVSLQQLLDELAKTGLDSYGSSWKAQQGSLSIPRFKIETRDLDIPLPGRGIAPSSADISAMCKNAVPPDRIETKQWTNIDFNENGTIAASLTEVSMSLGSSPGEKFEIKVDRPFAFLLGNSRTGNLLFAGVVFNPRDSKMPFAEAEQDWLKRLAAARDRDPESYCRMLQKVAEFYRTEERQDKAEEVLVEASKIVGLDNSIQIDVLDDLARTLVAGKKYDEAIPIYTQLLAIQKRDVDKYSRQLLVTSPILAYKGYLEGYAKLLTLMKGDLTAVNTELEGCYRSLVDRELAYFGQVNANDFDARAGSIKRVVDAKIKLAEFYMSIGLKEEAGDCYDSALASIFASPEPNYSLAIKIGKIYLKLLKDAKLDWKLGRIQSDLNTWTIKMTPPAKGKVQPKTR